ncbi:MAG: type II toxin-antitoxin system HicB family antitoxin [Coleofasciculaceae cyanobacterium SM2_1_6]|nr:type II toxin-antitoxin system HicB family antitoxin [Coleofasciculaceae cyanobacterium SM2_1_6]
MNTIKFLYWQDEAEFIGYLLDYPDYWTQGQTFEDLMAHLRDLYNDLTSKEIPNIRKIGELVV